MTTILGNVFREYRLVSAGQLQAELNMFRQDLSTGLVEIAYPGSDTYYIIFTEGRPNEIYQHGPNRVQRLDSINPHTFFANKGEASLRICPVPLRFFRAIKTILAFTTDGEQIVTQTSDVIAQLAVLQKTPEPIIVQITWPSSEGFVFLPGNNWPAREFLFISEGQARDNNPGVTIISRWPERECTFHIYRWNPAITIWRENNLFVGFSTVFEKILERYDELAGRALVTRLENDLNITSRNLSIEVIFSGKTVDDLQIFPTAASAVTAYRSLFKTAFLQISAVVGPRLMRDTLEESLDQLSPPVREILLEMRIFDTAI